MNRYFLGLVMVCLLASRTAAQPPATGAVRGRVTAETGGPLPGVAVEIRLPDGPSQETLTNEMGEYAFEGLAQGRYQISFELMSFTPVVQSGVVVSSQPVVLDVVMHFQLSAEVTVTRKRLFVNVADADNPAENLVGIAQSASQGAISARQVEERPLMRTGEVLEMVPGVITTQHSGEGKANQYFLRGFNLDHGTDLAQTVAGMPVNMPTHAHGQGYSDLSFMIPELVSGVQFSKGPYFAEEGDFATAGASHISYATKLDRPIVRLDVGEEGYGRAVAAASPALGSGRVLGALEVVHNDGPWVHPDDYRKINGVLRYSRGDAVDGLTLTAMAYHGRWNASDQVPRRALDQGLVSRYGTVDPTDGGESGRYSASLDWQHGTGTTVTKVALYGIGYNLHLFSNLSYYLDDPVHGDQTEQADGRFIAGGGISQRRLSRWGGRPVQNTYGVQIRHDDITTLALYHTQARVRLETKSGSDVAETQAGVYEQNEIMWTPWLRTLAGIRADGARFRVVTLEAVNSGTATAGLVSPKGGVTLGPWKSTEFYANGGTGFHSNDARGTTLTRDAEGNPVDRVTPLVRAKGAEVGVRSIPVPHLQTTVSVWMLSLDSELLYAAERGVTEPSRPSRRHGVEWTNYYRPRPWVVLDFDASWSQAHFTTYDPVGQYVPQAVGTVLSGGVTFENIRRVDAGLRWRFFGPRALEESNTVRSEATSLINLQAGYRLAPKVHIALDVFNLLNAPDADIDYYYTSRLPGEPAAGVADIHTHPTIPRTFRLGMRVSF